MTETALLWGQVLRPLSRELGWILLHSLWVGVVVGLVAATMLVVMKEASSAAKCNWLFLALVAIPVGSIVAHRSCEIRPYQGSEVVVAQTSEAVDGARLPTVGNNTVADGAPSTPRSTNIAVANAAFQDGETPDIHVVLQPTEASAVLLSRGNVDRMLPWLVGVWMIGVLLLALRLTLGWFYFQRICQMADRANEQISSLAAPLARSMGIRRPIRWLQCSRAFVPASIGFLRPIVLMPLSVSTNLTIQELQAILAHELAHIRRSDFLVNIFQVVVETLFFHHPAVWWISKRLRQEREHACDDLALTVTADRLVYARALNEVARFAKQHELALAANGGDFSSRIHRILGTSGTKSSTQASWLTIAATMLCLTVVAFMLPSAAGQQRDTDNGIQREFAEIHSPTLQPITGTIVGPDEKPLAGATVYLRKRPSYSASEKEQREFGQVTTDRDGSFSFREVAIPLKDQDRLFPLDVIATKRGHSVRWKMLNNPSTNIRLHLKKEFVLRGTILDEDRNPVSSAKLRIRHLMSLNTLTKIDTEHGHTPTKFGDSFLDVEHSNIDLSAVTDAQGRFAIRGLPERVGLLLRIDDRRLRSNNIYAATTNRRFADIPAGAWLSGPKTKTADELMSDTPRVEMLPIHSNLDDVIVKPGVHVRLRFVDDKTGQPIENVTMKVWRKAPDGSMIESVSDKNGRCDFFGLMPSSEYWCHVQNHPEYLVKGLRVKTDVEAQVNREVRLRRGAVLSGRVVDSVSKKGVPNVSLAFVAGKLPAEGVTLRRLIQEHGQQDFAEAKTDLEGTFRLVAPSVPGVILFDRVPTGFVSKSQAEIRVVADVEKPITDLELSLERLPAVPIRFVDANKEPVRTDVKLRVSFSSNTFQEHSTETDDQGRLDLSQFVDPDSCRKIFLMARSEDGRLAGYLATSDLDELKSRPLTEIKLMPVASLRGKVTDAETNQPIDGARVHLSFWYDKRSGQGVAFHKTDAAGEFKFESLVPGLRYSLGFDATNYLSINSSRYNVTAEPSQLHSHNVQLKPRVTRQEPRINELAVVQPPDIEGLPAAEAYELLLKKFKETDERYQKLVRDPSQDARQIVTRCEPRQKFVPAFMQLAETHRNTEAEYKALAWICGVSLVHGSSERYRAYKPKAAAKLLETYADRDDLSAHDVIYASSDRYEAAKKLMQSQHPNVGGPAHFEAARLLYYRHRSPFGGHEELRAKAVELLEKVVAEYAEVPHWRGPLGQQASNLLFRITKLRVGLEVPEIEGFDLNGKELKLSTFRGKVVLLHFWEGSLDSKRIQAILEDHEGQPIVALGVNTDQGKNLAAAIERQDEIPLHASWSDPDRKIYDLWDSGWPSTHVIGHDGTILFKNRETPGPMEEVVYQAVQAVEKAALE